MRIALVGAESTGKTRLANALADALRTSSRRVAVVPELLRAWCLRQGREPRPDEYIELARAQERAVDEASAGADLVITDTTALVVATYSAIGPGDTALWSFALERQRGYDCTLLAGLDLPWVADGSHRVGPAVRADVDAQLRRHLDDGRVAFRVVYGTGAQRLAAARAALGPLGADHDRPVRTDSASVPRWRWLCDRCSDPACEHRLLAR